MAKASFHEEHPASLSGELKEMADQGIAEQSQWFFKTGEGEYGEGDRFLGIRVPELRKIARRNRNIPLDSCSKLLDSAYHEERLLALFILVLKFEKGDESLRKAVFDLYFEKLDRVNNWDLIDSSAPHIAGAWLADKKKDILYTLALSDNLWERRIAILATFFYIKNDSYDDTLAIAGMLKGDSEDLIHKAVGWMLREVGKRDGEVERAFLREHCSEMPRTMLRYAIERFPEDERQRFLKPKLSVPTCRDAS